MGYFSEKDIENNDNEIIEEREQVPETSTGEIKHGIVVNAKYVNARKSPSKTGESVIRLQKGTEVEILGEERDYYKVHIIGIGRVLYVVQHFIEVK